MWNLGVLNLFSCTTLPSTATFRPGETIIVSPLTAPKHHGLEIQEYGINETGQLMVTKATVQIFYTPLAQLLVFYVLVVQRNYAPRTLVEQVITSFLFRVALPGGQ